jgi:membrane protease YdiL (CAAX protease family)
MTAIRPRLPIRGALAIGCTITLAAAWWFWHVSHMLASAVFVICPGIAFTAMLVMGADGVIESVQNWVERTPFRIVLVPAGLWTLYVIYAIGMGIATVRGATVMAVYLAVPFVLFAPFRNNSWQTWIEPIVILWVWLPLELGIVRSVLITHQGTDLHYAFAQLLAIDAGLVAFTVWNRTPGIGFRFEWDRSITVAGVVHFLMFAVIAIPLGIGIDFIHYSFTGAKLIPAPAAFAGIFFFTALPEEFLFRGLIQNWLQRTTRRPAISLGIAALIFGASHLNNGPPVPNYRYFLLASIAGVFYGLAWRRSGSLMASSLTHALVDTLWSVFFR